MNDKKVENKNIEMMKKLIEEKKNKGMKKSPLRAQKTIGDSVTKVKTTKKGGGLFDK